MAACCHSDHGQMRLFSSHYHCVGASLVMNLDSSKMPSRKENGRRCARSTLRACQCMKMSESHSKKLCLLAITKDVQVNESDLSSMLFLSGRSRKKGGEFCFTGLCVTRKIQMSMKDPKVRSCHRISVVLNNISAIIIIKKDTYRSIHIFK